MDTQRLILLFIFSFSLLMLWEAWEKEHRPKPASAPAAQQGVPAPVPAKGAAPASVAKTAPAAPASGVPAAEAATGGETIRITPDFLVAEIDTLGGTLKRLELARHKDSNDEKKNYQLLGEFHHYAAQSGITGDAGPNHRSVWRAEPGERSLAEGRDTVELRLTAAGKDGLQVQKVYTFKRSSYVVDVALELRHAAKA